jgi:hypothetical protein
MYGKIVDFNINYFPNLIPITYASAHSVNKMFENDNMTYTSKQGEIFQFNAVKSECSLFIRNSKSLKIPQILLISQFNRKSYSENNEFASIFPNNITKMLMNMLCSRMNHRENTNLPYFRKNVHYPYI